ncbi:helix-turn-helix domain-containing protein [Clostridioides sp. ES-S-0010-02]|uniref:helix-turn-helix domain-containing protein n=1 Tax=Clostridioides sp. ES-S-0010-02 TaxID=2770776 RepID=UPI001D12A6E6|nr:helix-turn-helix domain-containing protein [Clostridioides sp. ES-S-0010-02]
MCLDGKKGLRAICKMIRVGKASFYEWIHKYEKDEAKCVKRHLIHSTQINLRCLPLMIIIYVKGSLEDIAFKYNLSFICLLQSWVMKYNNHNTINRFHNRKEDKIMIKVRKITYDEKIEIVTFCIENNDNYQLTLGKYKVLHKNFYT